MNRAPATTSRNGGAPLPSTREHLRLLARRVARALAIDPASAQSFADGGATGLEAPRAALHAVASQARRLGARSLDATLTRHSLRVALDGGLDEAALPTTPGRAHAMVRAAFGVPLALERGRFVSLPTPSADAPAVPALAALALDYLARIRANEIECILDVDPEGVHQLRVGARRLRVVLRVLQRVRPSPAVDATIATVRAVAGAGGTLRDHDVVLELLGGMLGKGGGLDPATDADAVATATSRVLARRAAALTRLRDLLGSSEYDRAMVRARDALQALAESTDELTVAAVARGHMARELRRLARTLAADLTEPEAYHDVRRQARRVRDTGEVFGDVLRKSQRGWRRRLQPVQTLLGQLNDLDVSLRLVPKTKAVRAVRVHLGHRRYATLAEMAVPLALLAVAVLREVED